MKSITSAVIGELQQDDRVEDWWESQPVTVPFFGRKKLPVCFMDCPEKAPESFISRADAVLSAFLAKDKTARISYSELVYDQCQEAISFFSKDELRPALWKIKAAHEVWKFVKPTQLQVQQATYGNDDFYVTISCECDWDPEHGFEMTFRRGINLVKIGSIEGILHESGETPFEKDNLMLGREPYEIPLESASPKAKPAAEAPASGIMAKLKRFFGGGK